MGLYYGSMKSTPVVFRGNGGSGGDTIWAYYNGSDIEAGKRILLTNVGYTLTGSDTLSPEVRVSFLTEQGYAGLVEFGNAVLVNSNSSILGRYDIVNGTVDKSSVYKNTTAASGESKKGHIIPYFFKNGQILMEALKSSSGDPMGFANIAEGASAFWFYTYSKYYCGYYGITASGREHNISLMDNGYVSSGNAGMKINILKDTFTSDDTDRTLFRGFNLIELLPECTMNMDIYSISNGDDFYIYYTKDNQHKNWELAKLSFNKDDGSFVVSTLFNNTIENYITIGNKSGNVTYECKGYNETPNGFTKYIICADRYVKFNITTSGENSTVEMCSYPQYIHDVFGNRTIYKMQAFYDKTFSFDLSDGTTVICKFSEISGEPEIIEIVEPFIIDGDETVYHRTFTETRKYWYQRPENVSCRTGSYNDGQKITAPISSNPYGPYNATRAIVDWLAVPREENRWNTTVLTGFMTGESKIENGRQLVGVKTTLGI
jgi:hypothetical protein